MAIINFKPDTYIVGFWMFPVGPALHPPCGGDVMSCIFRHAGEETWTMVVRHRYTHPEQINQVRWGKDNKDRLTARYFKTGGEEDVVCKRQTDVMNALAKLAGQECEFFEVRGDSEKMSSLIMAGRGPNWMNMLRVETRPAPKTSAASTN